jgi:hypothetical protein
MPTTNIIRPVNEPGRILFTTTQNPLREYRDRASFAVEAANNYYTLKDRVKVLEEQNEKLRYNLDKCKALLQGQTGFEFKESESKL